MFKKPVWDDLSFVAWCIILLEVAIRRWVHCSHKGNGHGQKQYSGRLWRLNNAQLDLRAQSVPRNIPPTPLHHHTPAWNRETCGMDPCFHVLTPNSDPTIWMSQQKSKTYQTDNVFQLFYLSNLESLCECSLRSLFLAWQERHPGGLLLLKPICFRGFDVLCVQRWYSAIPWL